MRINRATARYSFVWTTSMLAILILVTCVIIVRAQAQMVENFAALSDGAASNHTANMPASGTITGKVSFAGPAPKLERAKSNMAACGTSESYDRLTIGKDHGVEYTLIYISNPPAGRANFPALVIDQKQCGYQPHLAIATRGSSVTFVNNDEVMHNVHGYYYIGSERSTAFNFGQPTKGQQTPQQLRKAGMVSVECDIHPWMNSWIWVTDNPYAAVTKADGTYSIQGLPPGTYTVVMWHEGWKLNGSPNGRPEFSGAIVKQQQVTVSESGTTNANFELN